MSEQPTMPIGVGPEPGKKPVNPALLVGIAALAALLFVGVFIGVSWFLLDDNEPAGTNAQSTSPAPGDTGTATTTPEATQTSEAQVPGGQTSAPGGTSTSSPPTTAAPTGPQIVVFRVKQAPACPDGTNLAPIEGKPLIIEWQVVRATNTELAVDGPGLYGSYGLMGEETFTFSCNGAPDTYETHTYTLRTVGGGPVDSETLNVSAKVNEIEIV